MPERYIYWLEELGQEFSPLVGKKCANLGEIARIRLPCPPGFAISVEAYEYFMNETGALQEIKDYLVQFKDGLKTIDQFDEASREIRRIVEGKALPEKLRGEIISCYNDLCEKCEVTEVPVSTRSAGLVSHPGQYETYLNVKGKSELLEKVKKVWSSTFNPRSLSFRTQKELSLESDPIGVAVVKMVNARTAGVLFTADPNTGDTSKMIIEANWGLGESVVGGEVTPDSYILDKESLEVVKRALGQKTRHVCFSETGVTEEETPADKCSAFCLSDEEIKEIGKLGKILEKHFSAPQDVEWAVDKNLPFPQCIILLQSRPVVISSRRSPVDQVVDYMLRQF
ncbi:MAG: PEP/pyruvate-binding domain-containing protein [Dehalococcoidia bacterium]|nr:PEP/pyruvate-binding domain-containing protein [Dehalococcoidia bacterium]